MLLKTQARAATAFFVGVALCISTVWAEALDAGANPCVSRSAELGDSAFWANTAVAQYADGDYQAAVTTVDACFGIWGAMAGQQQKKLHDEGEKCPRTGRVSARAKAKIHENYLMNDVSTALWARARSLHELGDIEQAKVTYGRCVYMACGRAWDPKGWFWSPAQDCANFARKLLSAES